MRRIYQKKTEKSYSTNDLHNAIKDYKTSEKLSCLSSAKRYGIPEATLRSYLKNNEEDYPVHGGRFRNTFSESQLKQLINYISDIDKRAFGLTKIQCKKMIFDFSEHNNIPHHFNRETKMAGDDWLANFMSKYKFSLRAPEATSIGQLMAFNKNNVQSFFTTLKELRLKYKFNASQIFNIDESGVSTVPTKLPKVIYPTGSRRVAKIVSGERGKNITVVCGMSAIGVFVPPFIIFPRKRMKLELMNNTPSGSFGTCNESGWMTSDTFLIYLEHFVKHVKPSAENEILLILDNHASHVSLNAINFCREKHIIMSGFPPHTTHRLQPLDVSVFGPLKTFYSQVCDNFLFSHPGRAIVDHDIGMLFGQAYNKAATVGNAVHGFRATGIEPYNPLVFSDLDFESSVVTDRPLEEGNTVHVAEIPPRIEVINIVGGSLDTDVLSVDDHNIPNETTREVPFLENNEQTPGSSGTYRITATLPPLPVAEIKIPKRAPRAKPPSLVIRSTPVKNMMEEKKQQKEKKELQKMKRAEKRKLKKLEKQKNATKVKKTKRQLFLKNHSSEESSTEEPTYVQTDDDDSADDECLFYLQHYKNDTKGEDWIKCIICSRWAHDLCAGIDDWKVFSCDFCNNKD